MLRWQSGILSWSNETQISLGTRPWSDPQQGLVFCQTAAFKPEPLQLCPWQNTIKHFFVFLFFLIRESEISVLYLRAFGPCFPSEGFTLEQESNVGKHQPLKAICLTWWWAFKTAWLLFTFAHLIRYQALFNGQSFVHQIAFELALLWCLPVSNHLINDTPPELASIGQMDITSAICPNNSLL